MCLIIKSRWMFYINIQPPRPDSVKMQFLYFSTLTTTPLPAPAFQFKKSLSEEIKSGWRHSWPSVTGWKQLKWAHNEPNNCVGKHNLLGLEPRWGRGRWWLRWWLAAYDEPSFSMTQQGWGRRWTGSNPTSVSVKLGPRGRAPARMLITEQRTGKSQMTGCFHRVLANSAVTLYLLK